MNLPLLSVTFSRHYKILNKSINAVAVEPIVICQNPSYELVEMIPKMYLQCSMVAGKSEASLH